MKKEKVLRIVLIASIIIIIGSLIGLFINKKNNELTNVAFIDINTLKNKIDNKESFILVISRDDCSHCQAFIPVINKIGKEYNVTFYDISETGMSSEDLTYLRNVANISGTPTTVFIVNGEEKSIQNRLIGEVKEYRVIEKLKAMGYINE